MDLIYQLEALNPTPDATNVNIIGEHFLFRYRTKGVERGGGAASIPPKGSNAFHVTKNIAHMYVRWKWRGSWVVA